MREDLDECERAYIRGRQDGFMEGTHVCLAVTLLLVLAVVFLVLLRGCFFFL